MFVLERMLTICDIKIIEWYPKNRHTNNCSNRIRPIYLIASLVFKMSWLGCCSLYFKFTVPVEWKLEIITQLAKASLRVSSRYCFLRNVGIEVMLLGIL